MIISEKSRLTATVAATRVIEQLQQKHGELIFHQSGGCCDGSMPMCFEKNDFMVGSRDICLGDIHGCKFYIAPDQHAYYENMSICLDIVEGRGSSFSLEIPLGVRFMAISTVMNQ